MTSPEIWNSTTKETNWYIWKHLLSAAATRRFEHVVNSEVVILHQYWKWLRPPEVSSDTRLISQTLLLDTKIEIAAVLKCPIPTLLKYF